MSSETAQVEAGYESQDETVASDGFASRARTVPDLSRLSQDVPSDHSRQDSFETNERRMMRDTSEEAANANSDVDEAQNTEQSISEIDDDVVISDCDSLEDDRLVTSGKGRLGGDGEGEVGSLSCSSSWKRLTGGSRRITSPRQRNTEDGEEEVVSTEERILCLEEEIEYYKNALDEVQDRFQEGDMLLIKELKEENSKVARDYRVLQYKYRRAQKELAEIESERDTLLVELQRKSGSVAEGNDPDDDMLDTMRRRLLESQEGKCRLQEEVQKLQLEMQTIQSQQQQQANSTQISSQEDLLHPDLDEKLLSRPRTRRRSRRDSELEAQVAKLEKDLETSRLKEDEITEHLREAEDHIDHLEGQIQFIQDEKTRLLAIMDALRAENRIPEELEISNGETVNALIARIHELEDENHNVLSQFRGLQSEYSLLDESFTAQKLHYDAETESRKKDLELMQNKLDLVEGERQGLTETNDVLKGQLLQLENQCGAYSKEVEELFNRVQDVEWQLKESYSEIANLKIELSFHKSSGCSTGNSASVYEHVHSEDSDSNTTPDSHDTTISTAHHRNVEGKKSGMKSELEHALLEVNQLKLEMDHLKQTLETKNLKIEDHAHTISSLESRLRDADSIEERLNKTISVLRSEKGLLQKEVTLYRNQCSKLTEVKDENMELKAHVASLKILLIEKTENVSQPIKKEGNASKSQTTTANRSTEPSLTPTSSYRSKQALKSEFKSLAAEKTPKLSLKSPGNLVSDDTKAEHDVQDEEHVLSPSHNSAAETQNPSGQHFGDDAGVIGSNSKPVTEPALDRMDKLISGKDFDSSSTKLLAAMPSGNILAEAQQKHEEVIQKYEKEKKKAEEDIADLEKILREVGDEKDKLEKRLKFEKESCEFQYKMEQKTWQKDKKTLETKIAELEAKVGMKRNKMPTREVTPPSLVFDSPTSHSDPNSSDEIEDHESEMFVRRLKPLTIPTSVVESSDGQQSSHAASNSGLQLPQSTPGSTRSSRSPSPSLAGKRLGDHQKWERRDLELHCAHLESEIDRLENDCEMYKTQVEEFNFKVEQLDESVMKQKRSNELVEKEREQLQQRFVKSLRERSDQDVAFRAERQQWAMEKEKLMLKLEELQRTRTLELRKVEQELHELGGKLRETEKEKLKFQFELEKTKHELDSLASQSPKSTQSSLSVDHTDEAQNSPTLVDKNVEKLEVLEKECMETQNMVNDLEKEIRDLRRDREELKHQLSEKETENLCWREWKDSEAAKNFKEKENKFLQEKESILHELTECQSQISFLKSKLAEQVSGGDLAGRFQEWMSEVNRLHERYRTREHDEKSLLIQTKQQLKTKQQQFEEREKELKDKLALAQCDLKHNKRLLAEKEKSTSTEISKLKNELESMKKDMQSKLSENTKLTKQIESQQNEVSHLKNNEEILRTKLGENERMFRKFLENLRGKMEHFLEQSRKNFHELKLQAESDIASCKHQIKQLNAEKEYLSRELETRGSLLQESQRSIEEKRARLLGLQREVRSKEEGVERVGHQLERVEFELQRKQQECLQLHQKLMAEQRRVVDIFNRHTNTLKIYQKQNRNSRNLDNWDVSGEGSKPLLAALLASSSSSTAQENTLDIVNEFRLINEELMVSMEKSQNARKGEVEVLEQQIASLKDEKLKLKQNLMTRINELEGQLRNVDLVHEQLKTTIEGSSKQQRQFYTEKQELMKKNAEMDLTKFSDRAKVYELQMELNKLKKITDLNSERGSKMSGLENYSFYDSNKPPAEDANSETNSEVMKVEQDFDHLMDAFLELSASKIKMSSETSLLGRVDSKKLQKSKSLDTDTDLTFIGLPAAAVILDDVPSDSQSYQKTPEGMMKVSKEKGKESSASSLPVKYQKKPQTTSKGPPIHLHIGDRQKNKVLHRSNTNPLNQLEEIDVRCAGGSESDLVVGSLDRKTNESSSSHRSSPGSSSSGQTQNQQTRKKHQIFSFFSATPKKDKSKADSQTLPRVLGSSTNEDVFLPSSSTAHDLSSPHTPVTPPCYSATLPSEHLGFSSRSSDASLSTSYRDFEFQDRCGKDNKLTITQSETSIGISSGLENDDASSVTTSPNSTMSVPRSKKRTSSTATTLNKFTRLIGSRSRSAEKQLNIEKDYPDELHTKTCPSAANQNSPKPRSESLDQEVVANAEKKWFFTLGRRKKNKASVDAACPDHTSVDSRERASSSSSVPETVPEKTSNGSTGSLEQTLAQAAMLVTQEMGALITEASDFEMSNSDLAPSTDVPFSRSRLSRSTDEKPELSRERQKLEKDKYKEPVGNPQPPGTPSCDKGVVRLRQRASSPMPRPLSTSSAKFSPAMK